MKKKTYIPLSTTARLLGLPVTYLKDLADKKAIPYLIINGRYRFNLEAVQTALDELATKGGSNV